LVSTRNLASASQAGTAAMLHRRAAQLSQKLHATHADTVVYGFNTEFSGGEAPAGPAPGQAQEAAEVAGLPYAASLNRS
jgi:hypothetical protein